MAGTRAVPSKRFRFASCAVHRPPAERQIQGTTMTRTFLLATAAMAATLAMPTIAFAQIGDQSGPDQSGPSSVETVMVTAKRLDAARNGIQTQTGAPTYTITAQDIESAPGGENNLLNQVMLQAPSVAQDSFGQIHVRGEHNALQY